jgi:cell division protein FtsB
VERAERVSRNPSSASTEGLAPAVHGTRRALAIAPLCPSRYTSLTVASAKRTKRRPPSLRNWLFVALGYCSLLLVLSFFGNRGLVRGRALGVEIERANAEIARLSEENERLQAVLREVDSRPALIERKAREELNLVRPDELVYLFGAGPAKGR